ncbi:hypothetical protein [Amaricoccus solimangrovi]|uniref:hypothetical protein n=1 Tax=Amaricoccus solimangrovi TaxID=2589815 RepID=UPI0015E29FE8|nr:hypothetical protein [Amaricoccus solimangrovi]
MTETAGGPVLTLPEAEAAALRRIYSGAEVILEYGSGGSTVLAAGMPGKTVTSVESDAAWAAMVATHVAGMKRAESVAVRHVDIGPTRKWGAPTSRRAAPKFPDYPLAVWSDPGFRHPDVVLIDGRFRPACFATVAMKTEKPVTVLFDDYETRPRYREVERLAPPAEMIGRMARFELTPGPVPKQHLDWIISTFVEPDYAHRHGLSRLIERMKLWLLD